MHVSTLSFVHTNYIHLVSENVNQDLEALIDSFNKICVAHLEEKSAKVT